MFLGRNLVGERSIEADSRSADEDPSRVSGAANGLCQALRRPHAAVKDALFLGVGPAAFADRFTGEVDDCVGAVQSIGPGTDVAVWIPGDEVARSGRRRGRLPGEDRDVVTLGGERLSEGSAEKPGSTSEHDSHQRLHDGRAGGRP
jgi:hypothetical protein